MEDSVPDIVKDLVNGIDVSDVPITEHEILSYIRVSHPDAYAEAEQKIIIAKQHRLIQELREQADKVEEVDEDAKTN